MPLNYNRNNYWVIGMIPVGKMMFVIIALQLFLVLH